MSRTRRQHRRAVAATVIIVTALWRTATPGAEPPPAPASTPAAAAVPFWQAPALPSAVIHGGAIPPGWQPQAVPYQGTGPDGRPLTMYFAPTYVFTYQAGPPVGGASPVARPQAWAAPPPGGGWNYRTSGAQPVPLTLSPNLPRAAPTANLSPAAASVSGGTLSGPPAVPPAVGLP